MFGKASHPQLQVETEVPKEQLRPDALIIRAREVHVQGEQIKIDHTMKGP